MKRKDIENGLSELMVNGSRQNDLSMPQKLLLSMLLDQYENYSMCKTMIKKDGVVTSSDSRNGTVLKAHPAIEYGDKSLKNTISLLRELELSPQNAQAKDIKKSIDNTFDLNARPKS